MPFADALFRGLAPDGGLYVPVEVPRLDPGEMVRGRDFRETSLRMARGLLHDEVEVSVLEDVVAEALDFPVPLVPLGKGLYVLELFHGPTLAFKDVGARFMAALMERLDPWPDDRRTVLVATSGDTGSAVARAFEGRDRFRVVVLFPRGGVSEVQRRLFTTAGGNVVAAAVRGDFDDCQRLAKEAFGSPEMARFRLTSANSINVGRLLPQSFYYVEAVRQGRWGGGGCVFSVPSGNLGNLTGGLLAERAGLPVRRFVAAVNANDGVHRWLHEGIVEKRPTRSTLSNAMDVGVPGNRERIAALFGGDVEAARRRIWSTSVDDEETLEAMRRVEAGAGYLADPHTAVGLRGAEAYRAWRARTGDGRGGDGGAGPGRGPAGRGDSPEPVVVLATAHPAKFPDVVERAVGRRPPAPSRLARALEGEEHVETVEPRLDALRDLLAEGWEEGRGDER